jgi:hypothetical protein
VKLDQDNLPTLRKMLDHVSSKVVEESRLPNNEVKKESVADTGATVCCICTSASTSSTGTSLEFCLPSSSSEKAKSSSSSAATDQGLQDEVQQHGDCDYQPLSACPARGGTVTEILHWAVPTQSQLVTVSQHRQEGAQQEGHQSDQGRDRYPALELRRSTRSEKGQKAKYKDYVESVSCRNIYEQKWPVLGG